MATFQGGCHCGRVRYEVDADFKSAMECNCTMCSKTATLLSFVPEEQFRLLSGDEVLHDYQFNRHVIHHVFCSECGIRSFARGVGPDGKKVAAINVRCIDGIDLTQIAIQQYDGKSK